VAFFIVIIASFFSLIGSFFISRKLFGGHTMFGDLALLSTQQTSEGYASSDVHYTEMMGQTGEAFTMLRPAGKVSINEQIFDAVAEAGFIDKGEPIRVVKYENAQLIVRKT
jgi:membrane-bound serine protease (ClpP class)